MELLAVIGIIAILIGLLMPALQRAREQSKCIQCMSQLRQVGVAIYAYAAANRGMTPCFSYRHEYPKDIPWIDPPGTWSGPGWVVLLEKYIGQKPDGPIWNCPQFPDKRVNDFISARWVWSQSHPQRSIALGSIRDSSQYILAGECSNPRYYPPPFGLDLASPFEDIDKDDYVMKCLVFPPEDNGYLMHPMGNNVLFGDGHVATFKTFDRSALSYSPLTPGVDWDEVRAEQ